MHDRSGSDSGHSSESATPLTPPEAPGRSVSASAFGDDEESEDDIEVVGMPTVGNIFGLAPEEKTEPEAEPEWKMPDWVLPREEPAPGGDVFVCTTHLNGRCKPAICQVHQDWVRAQKRKAGGTSNAWGRGNNSARAGEGDSLRSKHLTDDYLQIRRRAGAGVTTHRTSRPGAPARPAIPRPSTPRRLRQTGLGGARARLCNQGPARKLSLTWNGPGRDPHTYSIVERLTPRASPSPRPLRRTRSARTRRTQPRLRARPI